MSNLIGFDFENCNKNGNYLYIENGVIKQHIDGSPTHFPPAKIIQLRDAVADIYRSTGRFDSEPLVAYINRKINQYNTNYSNSCFGGIFGKIGIGIYDRIEIPNRPIEAIAEKQSSPKAQLPQTAPIYEGDLNDCPFTIEVDYKNNRDQYTKRLVTRQLVQATLPSYRRSNIPAIYISENGVSIHDTLKKSSKFTIGFLDDGVTQRFVISRLGVPSTMKGFKLNGTDFLTGNRGEEFLNFGKNEFTYKDKPLLTIMIQKKQNGNATRSILLAEEEASTPSPNEGRVRSEIQQPQNDKKQRHLPEKWNFTESALKPDFEQDLANSPFTLVVGGKDGYVKRIAHRKLVRASVHDQKEPAMYISKTMVSSHKNLGEHFTIGFNHHAGKFEVRRTADDPSSMSGFKLNNQEFLIDSDCKSQFLEIGENQFAYNGKELLTINIQKKIDKQSIAPPTSPHLNIQEERPASSDKEDDGSDSGSSYIVI